MQSQSENKMSDLQAENATQTYPVRPYWEDKTNDLCTQEMAACVDCMECWPDRD